MLTKKQIALLKPFQRNIFQEYGFRELGRLAGEKSHNALQLALKQFLKEKLVKERQIGVSKLYQLNTDNEAIYDYLELIKYGGLPKSAQYSIDSIKKEIEKYTLFYSLVIFGSYAFGEQKRDSDLDVAVLIPDETQRKKMDIAINMSEIHSLIHTHIFAFTFNEFFEMLTNKEANVGKEIANKHRAVHNINIFYKIIKKALEHGFRY
ncbi:MAG: nucleotidyltransferase domain-containing protein [Nanoarchaeota archaeon]